MAKESMRSRFLREFERKFRREMRIRNILKKNDRIFLMPNKDSNTFVAKYMLKHLGLPLRFTSAGKKLVAWSADREIEYFFDKLFFGNIAKKSGKGIKIMKTISQSEIDAFAEHLGYKGKKKKTSDVLLFLEAIEKRHGNLRCATAKAIEKIEETIR